LVLCEVCLGLRRGVRGGHAAVQVAGLGLDGVSLLVGLLLHGVGLGVEGVGLCVGRGDVGLVLKLRGGDVGFRFHGVGASVRFLLGRVLAGGQAGHGGVGNSGENEFAHGCAPDG